MLGKHRMREDRRRYMEKELQLTRWDQYYVIPQYFFVELVQSDV